MSKFNRILHCSLISVLLFTKMVAAQAPNILNYQGRIAVRGVNFDGNGQFKFALVDGGTTTTPATRTATGTAVITSGFVTSITLIDGGVGYTSAPTVTLSGGGGTGASATASMLDGAVTGFTITSTGSGYSSEPTVSVASPPEPTATTNFVTYWSNDGTSVAGGEPISSVSLPVTKGLFSVSLGDLAMPGMTPITETALNSGNVHLKIWFNDGEHGWQLIGRPTRLTSSPYAHIANTSMNVPDGSITASKIAERSISASNLDPLLRPQASGIDSAIIAAEQAKVGLGTTANNKEKLVEYFTSLDGAYSIVNTASTTAAFGGVEGGSGRRSYEIQTVESVGNTSGYNVNYTLTPNKKIRFIYFKVDNLITSQFSPSAAYSASLTFEDGSTESISSGFAFNWRNGSYRSDKSFISPTETAKKVTSLSINSNGTTGVSRIISIVYNEETTVALKSNPDFFEPLFSYRVIFDSEKFGIVPGLKFSVISGSDAFVLPSNGDWMALPASFNAAGSYGIIHMGESNSTHSSTDYVSLRGVIILKSRNQN